MNLEKWWAKYLMSTSDGGFPCADVDEVHALLAEYRKRDDAITKQAFLDKIAAWEKVGGSRDEINALRGMMEVLGLADFT